mmetsp:Transcript_95262/g.188777  ORF Transcript_95262/g.188777 Transcript_95262/m.188777 type:complete len:80 (+) Transcript_95262:1016-1255(+)
MARPTHDLLCHASECSMKSSLQAIGSFLKPIDVQIKDAVDCTEDFGLSLPLVPTLYSPRVGHYSSEQMSWLSIGRRCIG